MASRRSAQYVSPCHIFGWCPGQDSNLGPTPKAFGAALTIKRPQGSNVGSKNGGPARTRTWDQPRKHSALLSQSSALRALTLAPKMVPRLGLEPRTN